MPDMKQDLFVGKSPALPDSRLLNIRVLCTIPGVKIRLLGNDATICPKIHYLALLPSRLIYDRI